MSADDLPTAIDALVERYESLAADDFRAEAIGRLSGFDLDEILATLDGLDDSHAPAAESLRRVVAVGGGATQPGVRRPRNVTSLHSPVGARATAHSILAVNLALDLLLLGAVLGLNLFVDWAIFDRFDDPEGTTNVTIVVLDWAFTILTLAAALLNVAGDIVELLRLFWRRVKGGSNSVD